MKKQKKIKMYCNGCEKVRMGNYGEWCDCNPVTPYRLTSWEMEKEYRKINFRGLGKLLA